MGNLVSNSIISVVIPTLNESENLPLLLSDLTLSKQNIEVIIVDAGSIDETIFNAEISGAKIHLINTPSRGKQLKTGAEIASSEWLFFLHADSRLDKNWFKVVNNIINNDQNTKFAWYFDFKVKGYGIKYRILEFAVFLRCILLNRPYGDQGLLINKKLYVRAGGFSEIEIMEDLDFILRLSKYQKPKRIKLPLYTSNRKWKNKNLIMQSFSNAILRIKWAKGENPSYLARKYYQKNNNIN